MISLYRWDSGLQKGAWLEPTALRERAADLRTHADTLWIDLEKPSEEEETLVYQHFWPIHPLTLEDVTKLRRDGVPHFPKAEEFRDYLFVVVNPLAPPFLKELEAGAARPETRAVTQLSAILTEHVLITQHDEPLAGIKELKGFLSRHEAQAGRGPDYLFHVILDQMVDEYAPVLDHVDNRLDESEEEILNRARPDFLAKLLDLKRRIIALRKTLIYEREILARLSRGEFALIDERETVYYRNVYDHLVRFAELIEASREMASDLAHTHLAAMSNKLNEIMKVLTMISTVVLPMSLVAGVYGMNFKRMPELEWPFGYPLALMLMLLVGVGSFALFRWKKWI